MSIETLEVANEGGAVLYDATRNRAFGPLFPSKDLAEAFVNTQSAQSLRVGSWSEIARRATHYIFTETDLEREEVQGARR